MYIQHPFRETYLSRHHILSRNRGGFLTPHNTLRLWRDRHSAWHRIFGNLTIREIIQKILQNARWKIHTTEWKLLFKKNSASKVIKILTRVLSFKKRLQKKNPK